MCGGLGCTPSTSSPSQLTGFLLPPLSPVSRAYSILGSRTSSAPLTDSQGYLTDGSGTQAMITDTRYNISIPVESLGTFEGGWPDALVDPLYAPFNCSNVCQSASNQYKEFTCSSATDGEMVSLSFSGTFFPSFNTCVAEIENSQLTNLTYTGIKRLTSKFLQGYPYNFTTGQYLDGYLKNTSTIGVILSPNVKRRVPSAADVYRPRNVTPRVGLIPNRPQVTKFNKSSNPADGTIAVLNSDYVILETTWDCSNAWDSSSSAYYTYNSPTYTMQSDVDDCGEKLIQCAEDTIVQRIWSTTEKRRYAANGELCGLERELAFCRRLVQTSISPDYSAPAGICAHFLDIPPYTCSRNIPQTRTLLEALALAVSNVQLLFSTVVTLIATVLSSTFVSRLKRSKTRQRGTANKVMPEDNSGDGGREVDTPLDMVDHNDHPRHDVEGGAAEAAEWKLQTPALF